MRLFRSGSTLIKMALCVSLAVTSQATTLFSALPNQSNAADITDFESADHFVLASASTIDGFIFWDVEQAGAYLGSFFWEIYTNSAGAPGTLVANGTASPTRTSTGLSCCAGNNEFQNVVTGLSVALGPGTFWLALHDGALGSTTFANYYWEAAATSDGNSQSSDLIAGGGFVGPNGFNLAFQISGSSSVPEPSTFLLLALGLSGFGLFRARGQRSR